MTIVRNKKLSIPAKSVKNGPPLARFRERTRWEVPRTTLLEPAGSGKERRFSIIATCLNEESSILQWLDAVLAQTRMPTEVIICDAGSNDRTLERIREWAGNHPDFPFAIIVEKGASIARGRNIAVKHAVTDLLLFSDVGSLPDRDWAKELLIPLEAETPALFVMGRSSADAKTPISEALATLIVPSLSDPERFLPSARSMAVDRGAYQEIGGFPEELSFAGEDTLFGVRMKSSFPNSISVAPQAVARWQLPSSIPALWKMLFRYAKGDAESGLFYRDYLVRMTESLALGTGLLFALYWGRKFFLSFEIASALCLAGSLWLMISPLLGYRRALRRQSFTAKFAAPAILITAQSLGFIRGMLGRARNDPSR